MAYLKDSTVHFSTRERAAMAIAMQLLQLTGVENVTPALILSIKEYLGALPHDVPVRSVSIKVPGAWIHIDFLLVDDRRKGHGMWHVVRAEEKRGDTTRVWHRDELESFVPVSISPVDTVLRPE
ncbi:MAG: hypothetical protein AMXMBFR44_1870 [Candidatus Campbellbacteria bacterium]